MIMFGTYLLILLASNLMLLIFKFTESLFISIAFIFQNRCFFADMRFIIVKICLSKIHTTDLLIEYNLTIVQIFLSIIDTLEPKLDCPSTFELFRY